MHRGRENHVLIMIACSMRGAPVKLRITGKQKVLSPVAKLKMALAENARKKAEAKSAKREAGAVEECRKRQKQQHEHTKERATSPEAKDEKSRNKDRRGSRAPPADDQHMHGRDPSRAEALNPQRKQKEEKSREGHMERKRKADEL